MMKLSEYILQQGSIDAVLKTLAAETDTVSEFEDKLDDAGVEVKGIVVKHHPTNPTHDYLPLIEVMFDLEQVYHWSQEQIVAWLQENEW